MNNWDGPNHTSPPHRRYDFMPTPLIQVSPKTSFSYNDPSSILSSRHALFPTLSVLTPTRVYNSSQLINFNKELDSITSTQQVFHNQFGSILTKLDSLSPSQVTLTVSDNITNPSSADQQVQQDPLPADSLNCLNFLNNNLPSLPFHISPSTFSDELFSSNILWLGTLNVRSLVSSTKQLNLFSILLSRALHANRSTIADCHSTLIVWIRSAHSTNHHVLLGGDLYADLEFFLKQLSTDHPGPASLNPLFRFFHEQQFDDLCEINSSFLLPSPTFRSTSSGSLFCLDYIWIFPSFPIPYLWTSVADLTDLISTDHFLVTAQFIYALKFE
ncbi:hypothetical protein RhiirA5_438206 [Rhizophagus irregularis]|uniref:Endonuclease/exonuclease/phosphatase domain-containing protein n=1 Tax=Rhizophagus irregularis TaxID=588596 RepID=A0A2N0NJE6_9GLOM|nr:hypothetical protein RhiirA5_438206 [Rhizophagus irregularis]